MKKKDKILLEKIYSTPENIGSFSGVEALWRAVNKNKNNSNISRSNVKKFLESEDSYTKHKQPKRKFKRRKVLVGGISEQWQIDLIDMRALAKYNAQNHFIMTVIDVFSKKAYAQPVKNKEAANVLKSFKTVVNEAKTTPRKLQSDKGSEFLNKKFKLFCKSNKIKLFSSEDDQTKAQIVERFNKTLLHKIYRFFASTGEYKWIKVLPKIMQSYNNSYHNSIKMSPNEVNVKNEEEVFQTLYPPPDYNSFNHIKPKLKIGDYVRLLNPPKSFKKGYRTQWTEEIFKIKKLVFTSGFPLFKVVDLYDEDIKGFFYAQELQKIQKPDFFIIEKIISETPNKVLVKWSGYPEKFNSYVMKKDLKNYFQK